MKEDIKKCEESKRVLQRQQKEDREYIQELEDRLKRTADMALEFKASEYDKIREINAHHEYALIQLEEQLQKARRDADGSQVKDVEREHEQKKIIAQERIRYEEQL